jgi:hypothetical protein
MSLSLERRAGVLGLSAVAGTSILHYSKTQRLDLV